MCLKKRHIYVCASCALNEVLVRHKNSKLNLSVYLLSTNHSKSQKIYYFNSYKVSAFHQKRIKYEITYHTLSRGETQGFHLHVPQSVTHLIYLSISGIFQLLLTGFWPNFKVRLLWQSLTVANCHGSIWPCNICPCNICLYFFAPKFF